MLLIIVTWLLLYCYFIVSILVLLLYCYFLVTLLLIIHVTLLYKWNIVWSSDAFFELLNLFSISFIGWLYINFLLPVQIFIHFVHNFLNRNLLHVHCLFGMLKVHILVSIHFPVFVLISSIKLAFGFTNLILQSLKRNNPGLSTDLNQIMQDYIMNMQFIFYPGSLLKASFSVIAKTCSQLAASTCI